MSETTERVRVEDEPNSQEPISNLLASGTTLVTERAMERYGEDAQQRRHPPPTARG